MLWRVHCPTAAEEVMDVVVAEVAVAVEASSEDILMDKTSVDAVDLIVVEVDEIWRMAELGAAEVQASTMMAVVKLSERQ